MLRNTFIPALLAPCRDVDLEMLDHERGHGLAPAALRPEDKRQLRVRAERLKPMLVQALLRGVSNGLGDHVCAWAAATLRCGRERRAPGAIRSAATRASGELVAGVLAGMRVSGA